MKNIKQFLKRSKSAACRIAAQRQIRRGISLGSGKASTEKVDVESHKFLTGLSARLNSQMTKAERLAKVEVLSAEWRSHVRKMAGLTRNHGQSESLEEMGIELGFLMEHRISVAKVFKALSSARVLFSGQAYYNAWYLSRSLRQFGWKADLLNWDEDPTTQIYYHGQDFSFGNNDESAAYRECMGFYLSALYGYDVFHFSNTNGISFGWRLAALMPAAAADRSEILLLKDFGKIIVYSNNGCQDGVSQTSFSQWGPESACNICRWQHEPSVCSDELNLAWGRFRNSIADYQCLLGGNRVDFNDDPRVHETPEFYCLDPEVWDPQLPIPDEMRLPPNSPKPLRVYHAVGHRADRTRDDGVNIKSSHIYLPLVEKLQKEGILIELLEPSGIPNRDVRFLQMQADIFLDMLSFGWFGANAREAMMLGKPVICFIRPEWLESLRAELPDYAAELPIISATPESVENVLRELISNPQMRRDVGERGRRFAIKWHSAHAAGKRFDEIYTRLLNGDMLLSRGIRK